MTPGEAGNLIWITIYVLLVFAGISVGVMFMNWFERKVMAHMQVRLGPMRVGPHGLLQPIADALKLIIKEDLMPSNADKLVFWFAPVCVVMTAFCAFIVVPFGRTHAITDMNIGVVFMLGVSSLGVLGVIMAGWASNSHYSLMGSLRSGAQMVSYEVAMSMAVVSAVMMTSMVTGTGTLSMIGIVQAQMQQHIWFAFSFFPVGLIALAVFAIAMVAETNRAPFDLPEAESELVAGFMTEYSGFRWSLFFLAEYTSMMAVSSIADHPLARRLAASVPQPAGRQELGSGFLAGSRTDLPGCWRCCVSSVSPACLAFAPCGATPRGWPGLACLLGAVGLVMLLPGVRDRVQDIFWFTIKVAFFMYFYIWGRTTFPRYRFDQLMKIGWKVLLPISIGVVILTALIGVRQESVRTGWR